MSKKVNAGTIDKDELISALDSQNKRRGQRLAISQAQGKKLRQTILKMQGDIDELTATLRQAQDQAEQATLRQASTFRKAQGSAQGQQGEPDPSTCSGVDRLEPYLDIPEKRFPAMAIQGICTRQGPPAFGFAARLTGKLGLQDFLEESLKDWIAYSQKEKP